MAQSMTGYGAAEGAIGSRRLRAEIRTVNHRFFNFSPRLPSDLSPHEAAVREAVRRWIDRGHVSLSLRWVEEDDIAPALVIDEARAVAVTERLRELREVLALEGDVSVDLVARQPGVLSWTPAEREEPALELVVGVVDEAARGCRAEREREGATLATAITEHLDRLAGMARSVEQLAPARLDRERQRLGEALRDALGGELPDPARVAQELALQADRLDISEELVRLASHLDAARAAIASDQPVGKRLGFLAQELNREINTIGSKANDAGISALVIDAKGDMEKIREQLENLE